MNNKMWRVVQTNSNQWFVVSFPDNEHNVFGQPKKRYKYVSLPMELEQARKIVKKASK